MDEMNSPFAHGPRPTDTQIRHWTSGCQAIFAGFVASAHLHDMRPSVQDFWGTPQRDMILPSLRQLQLTGLDSESSTERQGGLDRDWQVSYIKDAVEMQGDCGERGLMRTLYEILMRDDNRLTRPIKSYSIALTCHPDLTREAENTESITDDGSTAAPAILPVTPHPLSLLQPSPRHISIAPDPLRSGNVTTACAPLAPSASIPPSTRVDKADEAATMRLEWRLTPRGAGMFTPDPTPVQGTAVDGPLVRQEQAQAQAQARLLDDGRIRVPKWWNM